jgi:hypothetical protein
MQLARTCLALLALARAAHAEPLPAFERSALAALPDGACQELRVDRVGDGVLEIRFFTEHPLEPAGPDAKTSGASLLLAATDPTRASFALYDASGIYPRSARIDAPIRWARDGARLCVASGSRPVLCGPTAGEVDGTARIAFGAGWETSLTGCAALPASLPGARPWLALDPWRGPRPALLEAGALVGLLIAVHAALSRRRSRRARGLLGALGLLAAATLLCVPHPVATEAALEPAVPPLWLDTASWHPRAPHQSLEFRGTPLAGLEAHRETWLVVGGSVAFGEGVDADETFSAVAQRLLGAEGSPAVVLNGGLQGWNIQNIDRFLLDLGDSLPLSGIVLVSILNNVTLPVVGPRSAACDASLVLAHLCNASRSQLLFTWPKLFVPKPHNFERYQETLRRLLAREQSLGRRVVMLDEASTFDRRALSPWNADRYRRAAAEIAAERGVGFHRVDDLVAALPPGDRFLDEIHPTRALHAEIGARLHAILRHSEASAGAKMRR